ncbi:MAG: DUF308 domain-containing protein [Verrucomicrobia bacterium]|nr:DUF308 domain-containing protein [Verrucomicrobiota bacterium]
MRIRSAVEIEDPAAGAEPSNRERRIKAGYRRLLRAVLDGKGGESEVQSLKSKVGHPKRDARAAEVYLSRFLCVGFVLALAVTGCAGPRPLKGGKAVTTRKPTGVIEQTLVQGENASQPTKQSQETVKVRTYTVPAGSRMERSQTWEGERPREPKFLGTEEVRAREDARPPGREPSTINSLPRQSQATAGQPSTSFELSAPMPVVERDETRTRTELGAAQKDTARELGAKLASLKGIVWVGVGLFVFGLASLVYPPLKVVIGSVTTSAALMLGGVALMVLPTLVVGNELLILGAVALAVGGWFLAHRHGQLRGQVAASTGAQNTTTDN